MKIPLLYSRVPMAPSHNTGDCFSRASRSVAIVSRIQEDGCFCIWARRPAEILRRGSDIIRFLASKSLSLMLFGVPGLKRILASILVLVAASVIISCGSKGSSATTHKPSGLAFRVFISNPLFPGTTGVTGTNLPVMNIVNAAVDEDVLSTSVVTLAGDSSQPGLMAVSPDLKYTLVY